MANIYRFICADEQTEKMRQAMYEGMLMKRHRPNDNDGDHASQLDAHVDEVTGDKQTRNMANIERISVKNWRRNEPLDEERKNEEISARFDRRHRKHDEDDNDDDDDNNDEAEFGAKDRRAKQAKQRFFLSNLDRRRTHLHGDADHDITLQDDNDKDGIQIVYVGDDESIIRRDGHHK